MAGASGVYAEKSASQLMQQQEILQQLNEGRFDSMQRLVGFLVLFHKMATDVQGFWPTVSFGCLNYNTSRSQSILRVASTASPVSGTEVRDRMLQIGLETKALRAVTTIQKMWRSQRVFKFIQAELKRRGREAVVAQLASSRSELTNAAVGAHSGVGRYPRDRRPRWISHDIRLPEWK